MHFVIPGQADGRIIIVSAWSYMFLLAGIFLNLLFSSYHNPVVNFDQFVVFDKQTS